MIMKFRSILSMLLAVILLASCCLIPANAAAVTGDVDEDGAVTVEDARLVLRYAVKLEAPTTYRRPLADLDGDGTISVGDARTVLRIAIGLDSQFGALLYSHSHALFYKSFKEIHPRFTWMETILNRVDDWCCYYTIHDVYRPVLEKMGYSSTVIDRVAPVRFGRDKLAKAASSVANLPVAAWMTTNDIDWYVPSLLLDYYLHSDYVTSYVFWEYYDDVITDSVISPTKNVRSYKPQVGDIVFMSNKEKTYKNGYPTADHTAQITQVYPDGTFLCTEGSIVQSNEEDGVARVRERVYKYDSAKKTYVFVNNPIVNVLVIVRPILDIR
mgnify:CR=1 FL=1